MYTHRRQIYFMEEVVIRKCLILIFLFSCTNSLRDNTVHHLDLEDKCL